MVSVWFDPFWTKKQIFINIYFPQMTVIDNLKRPFLAHTNHKNYEITLSFVKTSKILLNQHFCSYKIALLKRRV